MTGDTNRTYRYLLTDSGRFRRDELFFQVSREVIQFYGRMKEEFQRRLAGHRAAGIRRGTTIPVASCECLFGRRDFKPFFDAQAVDVAIVDTPWNGVAESVKIASMADV